MSTIRALTAASALAAASPAAAGLHEPQLKALPKPITQTHESLLGDGQPPFRTWDNPPLMDKIPPTWKRSVAPKTR